MTFTTRTLKATPAPDPEAVTAAAEQFEIVRQALLKAARHLDASSTRRLHIETSELKDRADQLSVKLTEFAGD